VRRLSLVLVFLSACRWGDVLVRAERSVDGAVQTLAGGLSGDVLYAFSTDGVVQRLNVQSGAFAVTPASAEAPSSLSLANVATTGAAYFHIAKLNGKPALVRARGYDNTLITLFDVDVREPFHVSARGSRVYATVFEGGLVSIDDTSSNVAVVDTTVQGAIAVDDDYVYFESDSKIRRTTRANGTRDASYSVDVPAGRFVKTLVKTPSRLIVAVSDRPNDPAVLQASTVSYTRERTIFVLTPTGSLLQTAAVADETHPIVANDSHVYFCAPGTATDTALRFSRVPFNGAKPQTLSIAQCPFALDSTYVYLADDKGLRRASLESLPRE
jgi:hypothetical protein